MLPSWTESRAALLPGRAVLAAAGGPVQAVEAGTGWEGSLTALQELLAARRLAGGVSLTLSHHFVRLFLVAAPPTWLRRAEMQAWLAERLADTLEAVTAWRLVWQDTPPGRPIPVCAILAERLDDLQALLARHGRRPRHIRPWLDVTWTRRRRQLGRVTGWYALLEPGMVSLLWLVRGRIARLRQRHVGDDATADLGGLLQREALLAGQQPAGEVWLERTGTILSAEGLGPAWRLHELPAPADPGLALLS